MASFKSLSTLMLTLLFVFTFPQSIYPRRIGEKLAHIHFYYHEVDQGVNQTSYEATKRFNDSSTDFGIIVVTDSLLTNDTDRSSLEIGRAQGIFALASKTERAMSMSFTFVFTQGKYNESSLNVNGRNPYGNQKSREMSIVGGTGLFRLARGYALTNTISYDVATLTGVYEYNVYVYYH
jgi:hypothetical protein